jgi:hypothetical protein
MYTKSHKNRVVDQPPLAPREVRCRRSRLGKVGVVAGGGMPACATPERTLLRSRCRTCASGIRRRVRASQIHRRHAPLGPPSPLLKPTTPHTTIIATGPGVRRRCSSALARPPQERRRRSILGERSHRSSRLWAPPQLASGLSSLARSRKPSSSLTRPRKLSPPLKPNP